jgi:hypothetical protein
MQEVNLNIIFSLHNPAHVFIEQGPLYALKCTQCLTLNHYAENLIPIYCDPNRRAVLT